MEIKIAVEVQERFIKAIENIAGALGSNGLIETGVLNEPECCEVEQEFDVPIEAAEAEEPKAEKIVTIKMSYDDLGDVLCVFEDWLNNINHSKTLSREDVARIYYRLTNIWGSNASKE
ncbi:hypothetical protein KQI68_06770 [Peptoniphilus sp. MSJ-1]|uniref:Uncharacterized protein n=1 Tax=Peptoniphilus ovalis TaxID=2841503 RepID=A0ABS6FJV8_9FIRM|nr:hypothetical protein [Peptoniphilus ovalis]MBU5669541.1 hypothetical protein [Peptoniphilus ovalis]